MKKLIVGLGNPEKKYEKTRHNIGFRVVDELEKSFDVARDKNIIFLKPDSYMNNSGKVVREYLAYEKISPENLIVVHDDIDLLFGDIRVSTDSSSAGHKGVQSIIDELKTQNFTRVRIGIKQEEKPAASFANRRARQNENLLAKFVLENFSKNEERGLPEIIKKVLDEVGTLLASCS
jgi:PTH1 family peptidyl-tRNA hydrolase